ncbi:hypothetical protein [Microbacterium sp.]|uniref:hypothetical protein n=1 Tax=Microbacterium sp. TaxID=51671 RepID=UPI003C77C3A3
MIRRILIWTLVALFFVLASLPILVAAGSNWYWVLTAWSGFPIVGAVILTARPRNGVGRVLLAVGMLWGLYCGLFVYVSQAGSSAPPSMTVVTKLVGMTVWPLIPLLVLVFPRGRIETRAGRIIASATAAVFVAVITLTVIDPAPDELTGQVSPWAVSALQPLADLLLRGNGFLVIPLLLVVSLLELGGRWRRADGAERLQFRWFAFGVGIAAAALAIGQVLPGDQLPLIVNILFSTTVNAIPVTIGIAITRYGLYEIGRVVSRTVSYVVVTALAVAVYASVVTSISLLLPHQPALPVALATLAAAAAFLPALRWVQHRLDRAFDRERYDAQRVVEAFGEHVRSDADPGRAAPELLESIDRTLQPTSVGVWTRTTP